MTPPTRNGCATRIAQGLAVVLIAAIFISLGIWQLDRAAVLKASLVTATTVDGKLAPLESITSPLISIPPAAINRIVNVSGRYVAEFRAPNQVDGAGKIDDWDVALLQVGADRGILVVRGLWSDRLINSDIEVPMVINVVGQLRAHQEGDRAENAADVISRLDSAVIVGLTNLDLFDGYILARSESNKDGAYVRARVTPEKLTSRIPGFYWQHLSYVAIWWLMAAVVLYLPFYRRRVAS